MITYLQMNSDPRNRRNQRSNGWTEEGCDELKMLKMLEMLEMPELLEMLDGHNLLSFLHSSYVLEELLQEPSPRTEQHVRRSNSAWSNFTSLDKEALVRQEGKVLPLLYLCVVSRDGGTRTRSSARKQGGELVPELVPDRAPEPVPDRAPEPVPDRAPEPVSDRAPEPVPDRAPEPVSDRAPELVPDRAPEPVPDRAPGDKCHADKEKKVAPAGLHVRLILALWGFEKICAAVISQRCFQA
ncbi:unnamed protein product [Gadus morhua 'NCC']